MAHEIKNLLKKFLNVEDNWKITLLRQWIYIIGELQTKVCLEKIHDDFLTIGVYDSCWLQELYLLSPILLKTINEKLENRPIKRLRFKQVGRRYIAQKKNKAIDKTIGKNIILTTDEQETLKHIKDPALEKVLKKFLMRCYQYRE